MAAQQAKSMLQNPNNLFNKSNMHCRASCFVIENKRQLLYED